MTELKVRLTGVGPYGFSLFGGNGDPLVITEVLKGSPAFVANLREGDLLMTINGHDCSNMTRAAALSLVNGGGSYLNLHVLRDETGSNFLSARTMIGSPPSHSIFPTSTLRSPTSTLSSATSTLLRSRYRQQSPDKHADRNYSSDRATPEFVFRTTGARATSPLLPGHRARVTPVIFDLDQAMLNGGDFVMPQYQFEKKSSNHAKEQRGVANGNTLTRGIGGEDMEWFGGTTLTKTSMQSSNGWNEKSFQKISSSDRTKSKHQHQPESVFRTTGSRSKSPFLPGQQNEAKLMTVDLDALGDTSDGEFSTIRSTKSAKKQNYSDSELDDLLSFQRPASNESAPRNHPLKVPKSVFRTTGARSTSPLLPGHRREEELMTFDLGDPLLDDLNWKKNDPVARNRMQKKCKAHTFSDSELDDLLYFNQPSPRSVFRTTGARSTSPLLPGHQGSKKQMTFDLGEPLVEACSENCSSRRKVHKQSEADYGRREHDRSKTPMESVFWTTGSRARSPFLPGHKERNESLTFDLGEPPLAEFNGDYNTALNHKKSLDYRHTKEKTCQNISQQKEKVGGKALPKLKPFHHDWDESDSWCKTSPKSFFRTTGARATSPLLPGHKELSEQMTFDLGRPNFDLNKCTFSQRNKEALNRNASRIRADSWNSAQPEGLSLKQNAAHKTTKNNMENICPSTSNDFDLMFNVEPHPPGSWKQNVVSSATRSLPGTPKLPRTSKFHFDANYVDEFGLDDLKASVKVDKSRGKLKFPELPPSINKILMPAKDADSSTVSKRKMTEDETDHQGKKVFADSSFYADPKLRYPTIAEQVKMARTVAQSLTSASNLDTRGHQMFVKRKQKADAWVADAADKKLRSRKPSSEKSSSEKPAPESGDLYYKPAPWNPSKAWKPEAGGAERGVPTPPPMPTSLLFAPWGEDKSRAMSAEEFERVRLYGQKLTHDTVSPQVCFDLSRDLKDDRGKGGRMFAKRRATADQWATEAQGRAAPDPSTMSKLVSDHAQTLITAQAMPQSHSGNPSEDFSKAPGSNRLKEMIELQKPTMTPWEAMVEYGNVDPAFDHMGDFQNFPGKSAAGSYTDGSSLLRQQGSKEKEFFADTKPNSLKDANWTRSAVSTDINSGFSTTGSASQFSTKPSAFPASGYRPVRFSAAPQRQNSAMLNGVSGSTKLSAF